MAIFVDDQALGGSDLLLDNEQGISTTVENGVTVVSPAPGSAYNARQQGVFAKHPLSTPKYAVNNGSRDAEFRDTLARMYISLTNAEKGTKDAYLRSLPQDDRVQALAKVLTKDTVGGNVGFIDFFLQQADESFTEKLQVDEVLSDNYVAFYFGQEPPVFQYSGTLLNSQQDDQTTGFALAYQHLLRGTSLAKRGALLRLRYDNRIVTGTINRMQTSLHAENELAVPFSFTMLVKEYVLLKSNLDYVKVSPDQFVQLQSAFTDEAGILTNVGGAEDTRVRTSALYGVISSESSVGLEEPDEPVDASKDAVAQNEEIKQEAVNQSVEPESNFQQPLQSLPTQNQSLPGA